ncbi:mRNA (2'-O-methyladenosine-N(6)-)-methyltransferase-like [Ptychodera flava]|uniref:mRNA (2'-O-methyladenosine-N(6)-)-methyltransferase-like n=1 Tax=Ptychodera flava TaxID=63121 RepID=UPI003969F8E6
MATPILSPRLLEEGWRKCYSVKAERPYYFNVKTNTSVWTMPTLSDQDERFADVPGRKSPDLPEPTQEVPMPDQTQSSQSSVAALVPQPSKPGATSHAEPSFSDMPNDLDRQVARRVAKYVYAKLILDEVNAIINQNCEGCKEDYPSQRDHECLYYGNAPAGQREAIIKYFTDAAKRVNMLAVQKSVLAMAELCYITLDHNVPLGLLDLDDLLELLYYRWSEDPEGCYQALSDSLSVYGMVLCNDMITAVCSKFGSASN